MAIGRFRDQPEEMDDIEAAVAAAQYPEGALVAGMGLGGAVPLLGAPVLAPVGAVTGGIVGFAVGRWYRGRRVRQLRRQR